MIVYNIVSFIDDQHTVGAIKGKGFTNDLIHHVIVWHEEHFRFDHSYVITREEIRANLLQQSDVKVLHYSFHICTNPRYPLNPYHALFHNKAHWHTRLATFCGNCNWLLSVCTCSFERTAVAFGYLHCSIAARVSPEPSLWVDRWFCGFLESPVLIGSGFWNSRWVFSLQHAPWEYSTNQIHLQNLHMFLVAAFRINWKMHLSFPFFVCFSLFEEVRAQNNA